MCELGGSSALDESIKGEGGKGALTGSNVSMCFEHKQHGRCLEVIRGGSGAHTKIIHR